MSGIVIELQREALDEKISSYESGYAGKNRKVSQCTNCIREWETGTFGTMGMDKRRMF